MPTCSEIGFENRLAEPALNRRPVLQLIATIALAVSTLVAATAVSIGFARAETAGSTQQAAAASAYGSAILWS